jgi:hypothetical protein
LNVGCSSESFVPNIGFRPSVHTLNANCGTILSIGT